MRTLDPERPLAAAVVVDGDRIAAVLDDPADVPLGARRVDLDGACVVPGLVDAHVHFPSWALARRELRLFGCASLAEALERVAAAEVPDGGWLRGRGWRDELWSEKPTRHALDAIAPGVKIALRAHDGHSLWLSSAALEVTDRLQVPGGVVEIDPAGEPTGILREESAWQFYDTHAEASRAEALDAMREALPAAAAAGVTGVHDKDGGRGAPELFAALRDAGELRLRVWQSLPAERLPDGIAPQLGDPFLRIGYVKAFMDGTLGSRTARLLDGSGVEITSSEALAGMIRAAEQAGFALAVHAIGDLANRDALDAFEAAMTPGARHRIEHAQCVAPEDVPRFAALGVTASMQYSHAVSDRELVQRIWADRVDHAYPFRGLLASGARIAAGSDAPVEELDPLAGLRAAAEEDVPAGAALESFTVAPAWLSFDEERRGRLRAGFDADLVVLDRDPLSEPASEVLGHHGRRRMGRTWQMVSIEGEYLRADAVFRRWIGQEGLEPEAGRYHLYVALACPWSHRAVIVRRLKGLEDAIGISYLHPFRDERGWAFPGGRFVDDVNGFEFLAEAYDATDPAYDDRISVPVLWDKRSKTIVNNESSEIIRMFGSAFDEVAEHPELDLYPAPLREEIDAIGAWVYSEFNNGVYRAGFSKSQRAYDAAFDRVFDALARIEALLGERRYLAGDVITEADWRLFPTLVRFDAVYHTHFRCNGRRIIDCPNTWGYARELFQRPGIADTVAMDEIKRHYYTTHDELNPKRIIPAGPLGVDWWAPHGRG